METSVGEARTNTECRRLGENPTGTSLVLTSLALLALGVVMVHSAVASVARPGPWYARVDVRHTLFAAVAAVVVLVGWRFDYRKLIRGRFPTLAFAALGVACILGVLVFVPGVGYARGGAHRWIRFGPRRYCIGFQPSELIKLTLVVFLAAWLSRESAAVRSARTFALALLTILGCVALVVTQDVGTAMLIGLTGGVTLFLAGVPLYYLLTLLPIAAGGFYLFVYSSAARWSRIAAMLDPWSRSNPSAFQARQSLMAALTGGWFGRGPGNGIRKLGFLPEDTTDFIFSVYCEEWGFVGAVLLMGLVFLWVWQARRAAVDAPDRFGRVLAGSLGFLIGFQAILHIAVDLVAAPPTGMGMPLVSAGGTALVMMAGVAAMVVSVTARRPARKPPPRRKAVRGRPSAAVGR
jgi:cell division protein FtsW